MADNDVNKDVNESYKIPDVLWAEIEPLLPPEKPKGAAADEHRKAMDAICLCLYHFPCYWGFRIGSKSGTRSTVITEKIVQRGIT